ncbi:MAG TPA: pilus assembly protein HicB [Terriglobia bacterium]|nr:pilus assembly protein HicB [Terriglobia bacterium]
MSKATYPLKLPLSVKKAAQRLAQEDGVSLNQWIAVAVAEKIGVVETAAEFFKRRAGHAKGAGLMRFLRHAPDTRPEAEDQVRLGRR